MERLDEAAERGFARHETFHPRYGWFRKAVAAAQLGTPDSDLFLADDATVELGVGKNMVRAIRFWGRAAKLLTDAPNPHRPRMPRTVPSLNGIAIFDEDRGLDPFMEIPGTHWLLHWWMLQPTSELPVWWITFNRFTAVEFAEEDLTNFVLDEIDRAGWDRPNPSTVKKDISCLLRMYSITERGHASLDDLLDCPMRELGLIEPAWGDNHRYRFVLGSKPTLPDLVVLFACLDWASTQSSGSTVSLNRLAGGIGSPGRVFRLGETELLNALSRTVDGFDGLGLSAAAGAPNLSCAHPWAEMSLRVLVSYYASNGRKLKRPLVLGAQAATPPAPAEVKSRKPRKSASSHEDVIAVLHSLARADKVSTK